MNRAISGDTVLAGVVGKTARRSLSPVIHNAWIAAAGLDAAYLSFGLAPDRFGAFIEGLRGGDIRGVNVTIPFKEEALALADSATPFAERAGAANLLLFGADGAIAADNTDGSGLLEALAGAGWAPGAGPVVVIGAGGAARAGAAALIDAGAPEVRVVNRTEERAQALAEDLDGAVRAFAWAALAVAAEDASAIVNATSLGGEGQPALDLPPAPPGAVVMDMVYRPLETPLLAQARARGHPTADGLAMLIAQARPSFTALFGRPVPEGVDVRGLCESAVGAAP